MAPELLLRQAKENCSIDVYAFALIMWELLHISLPKVRGGGCSF
jgi:hypothetical protein